MKKIVILCLTAGICMVSCGKKAVLRKYYVLEAPAAFMETVSTDSVCAPVHVDVRDFQISKAIDQTRIALRSDSHELNYYFYHHWAVQPSRGAADMVYDIIGRKNCFERLARGYSTRPDYIITGYIRHLERDETGKQVTAHLAGTIEFIGHESGKAVVKHEFDRMEPVRQTKSMNAFVEILCRIFYEETGLFAQQVSAYLTENTQESVP